MITFRQVGAITAAAVIASCPLAASAAAAPSTQAPSPGGGSGGGGGYGGGGGGYGGGAPQVPQVPQIPQAPQVPRPVPPVQAPAPQPAPAPVPQYTPPTHTAPQYTPPSETYTPTRTTATEPAVTTPPSHTVTTPPSVTTTAPSVTMTTTAPSVTVTTTAPSVTTPSLTETTPSLSETTPSGTSPALTTAPSSVSTPSSAGGTQPSGSETTPTTHSPALRTVPGPSGSSAVITTDGTTQQVPVAKPLMPVQASHEAVEAAKVAPPVRIAADAPPPLPPQVNFNRQIQVAVQVNAEHDQGFLQPRHWDYVDYDQYRRPFFFNPLGTDVSFRYFYGGSYRTAFVAAGTRLLLDAAIIGVFPFTVAAGAAISVGSFLGGAWIPPDGWDGPPPAEWVPWTPVTYDQVPVYFPSADQTVVVDRVTMVGHDANAPANQQDVFQLNDGTLARGTVTPPAAGSNEPPHVVAPQTQPLPGVSPWNDGQQYVNTQVTPVAKTQSNHHVPWVIGGVAAVLAALAGLATWVWRHPHGRHSAGASANAPTEWYWDQDHRD